MKYYNYKLAKELVEKYKAQELVRASLGMREDWFWTAETIWEDGKEVKSLFEGDVIKAFADHNKELKLALTEVDKEFEGTREHGIKRITKRAEISARYPNLLLGGICCSGWATPQLNLKFTNGTERNIEVSIEVGEAKESYLMPIKGVLSGPCDEAMLNKPIEKP